MTDPKQGEHRVFGVALAAPYLAWILSIQLVSYTAYLAGEFSSISSHLAFLATWPLAQGQHLLVTLFLYWLGRFCRGRFSRNILCAFLVGLYGVTVADQLAYGFLRDHTHVVASKFRWSSVALLSDSIVALVDGAFIVVSLLGLLALGTSLVLLQSRKARNFLCGSLPTRASGTKHSCGFRPLQLYRRLGLATGRWLFDSWPPDTVHTSARPGRARVGATPGDPKGSSGPRPGHFGVKSGVTLLVLYLLLSFALPGHHGLEKALLLSYGQWLVDRNNGEVPPPGQEVYGDERLEGLYRSLDPESRHGSRGAAEDEAIQEWVHNNISPRGSQNVVLIWLESLGTRQLFEDGRIDQHLAPRLARLSRHSLTFDAIYTSYPGTTLSHLAVLTGGYTITAARVYEDFNFLYEAPTIPRLFKQYGYRVKYFQPGFGAFENNGLMYKKVGLEHHFHAGAVSKSYLATHRLSSWGLRDDRVAEEALRWWEESPETPTLLMLNTLAAHHPYATPEGFPKPFGTGGNSWDDYRNAVAYVDDVVGGVIERLVALRPDDPPLVLILGDHGQAFGHLHPGNRAHGSSLYEENVRSFLMVFPGHYRGERVRSSTIGAHGDVFATLLDLIPSMSSHAVLEAGAGKSLLAPGREPRIAFFNKMELPSRVGLRDGRWKLTFNLTGLDEARLFDLRSDPDEQTNVADRHPGKVLTYRERALQWFFAMNQAFTRRLSDYRSLAKSDLRASDYQTPGPKTICIGVRRGLGDVLTLTRIHPEQRFDVFNTWVTGEDLKPIRLRWTSPSGTQGVWDFRTRQNWATTWTRPELHYPLEEGQWRISLLEGGTALMTTEFSVDRRAPLHSGMDSSDATTVRGE